MRMKMQEGILYLAADNASEAAALKSWNQVKWDKRYRCWTALVSLELLDKLSVLQKSPLPEVIEAERTRLRAVQKAVDEERMRPEDKVKPLYPYPVKKPLYTHQIRAANMCLFTFGLIETSGGEKA